MPDLTFGEQVKIILGRKGMTIKELAEVMEERTGKKMSRQNLTQRLGRDNFQEQDMRLIASILGCPFKLSILEEDTLEKQEERTEDERTEDEREYDKNDKTDKIEETDEEEGKEETEDTGEEKAPETGREITVGEFLEIKETSGESEQENLLKELLAEMDTIEREGQERERERIVRAQEREQAEEHQNAEKKGGWMSHFFRRRDEERITEAEGAETAAVTDEDSGAGLEPQERERAEEPGDAGAVPEPEEAQVPGETETPEETEITGEEEIAEEEEEAESAEGEINPYTGREYVTNSVRMHPRRIGYVQVYSRKDHKWTDMTEWAFLGEQERKKVLLGKAYEPPVYLD